MKYLGVDWGYKKIGLAFSEGSLSSPLSSFSINSLENGVALVVDQLKKYEADIVIIGRPEGKMGEAVEKVAKILLLKKINVILSDETLSTKEAIKMMIGMGKRKKAREEDNAVAAAIILQRFLDEQ